MAYEWRDLTGLEKPKQLEPCWRCDHPPLEVEVAKMNAEDRKRLPGAFRTDLPAAHLCICSHCGYSVPAPDDDGYSSPELAALRWNGEMMAKRMKMAEAKREFVLAGGKLKQFKFGTQLRSRALASTKADDGAELAAVAEVIREMDEVMACNDPAGGAEWKTMRIKDWREILAGVCAAGLPNVRIFLDDKEVARTVTTEGTDGYTEVDGDED